MSAALEPFAAVLRQIGGPDRLAGESPAAVSHLRMNAHIHLPPNFSAFDSVAQAVALADAQDVRVVGVSNYYDFSVYADFAAQAQQHGIFPLFGLEIIALLEPLVQQGIKINDPGNPGKMYLCGKGITRFAPMAPDAQALLQVIRDNDSGRMQIITDRLAAVFAAAGLDTGLNAEGVKQRVVARHGSPIETVYLQERHIAQAFQEVLFEQVQADERPALLQRAFGVASRATPEDAVAVQNEIRSHLMKAGKPAFVEDTFVDFDHAYRLILALGGIPCYPTLADGTAPLCPFEASPERLIAEMKARGICCAEFIPVRNTPEVLSRYVLAMREAGLFVTAGTEHNTLDLLPLEPTCANGVPIPEDIKAIFREGACVLAAHQALTLQGLPGFVDAQGIPNPAYPSDNARIEAFRQYGAALLAGYAQIT